MGKVPLTFQVLPLEEVTFFQNFQNFQNFAFISKSHQIILSLSGEGAETMETFKHLQL